MMSGTNGQDRSQLRAIAERPIEITHRVESWGMDVTLTMPSPADWLAGLRRAGESDDDVSGLECDAWLLSKMIRDDDGSRPFDTDEGRVRLTLDFRAMSDLREGLKRIADVTALSADSVAVEDAKKN